MNKDIKVSIIIPAYNVEEYIAETINSCLIQELKEIEIIVVNDGSKDNTLQKIEQLKCFDERIYIIDKKNGGVTSARQAGLEKATGEFIFFLDGDDMIYSSGTIKEMYNAAIKENSDFVSGDFVLLYSNGTMKEMKFPSHPVQNSKSSLKYALLNNDLYYTGRLIKKKYVITANQKIPRDITYGEDSYAVINILLDINKSSKINNPVLKYRQRETSVTNRLDKSDLIKRNEANKLIAILIEESNIVSSINYEFKIFKLRELAQSILLGVPNLFIYKNEHQKIIYSVYKLRKDLSAKEIFVLLISKINIQLAASSIQLVKKLK